MTDLLSPAAPADDAPAVGRFAVPARVPIAGSGDEDPVAFSVFDGTYARLHLDPAAPTFLDLDTPGSPLLTAAPVLRLHTLVARLDLHHPYRAGLVPRRVDAPVGSRIHATRSADAAGVSHLLYAQATHALSTLIASLPAEIDDRSYGWFPPHADPGMFGTYYLVPAGGLEAAPGAGRMGASSPLRWALRQVGIPGDAGHAGWDDGDGVAALVQMASTYDPELALTVRALSDTAAVADAVAATRRAQETQAARAAFLDADGTRLRPQLVPATIAAALDAAGVPAPGPARMFDLNDAPWFGWKLLDPCRAAALAVLPAQPREKFDTLARDLAARLAARDLGRVLVDPARTDRLWVTHDPDLLAAFPAAFDIDARDGLTEIPAPARAAKR